METLVDPRVSITKFDREIALYKNLERDFCSRGWFMAKAEFPEVFVVFTCPKVTPSVVMLGALLDFTNYDFLPPSVRLVNPFTRVPYKYDELPSRLERNVGKEGVIQIQPMMQPGYTPDALPFLCLPGIREYHDNPAHTGDSWLQRRGKGEGTLIFILEQIAKYGADQINTFQVDFGVTQIRLGRKSIPS